jgi:hypothetical protein
MATTTPNFGWSVPTSTDLVKDGATAIETLGDAIDASLVDLKGGTTGQILSKNSNSDMDFTWTSDAGFANPMTTTGDMIYSSSGSTPARRGIGSTGQVLTVAGGVPTWATPAGGGKILQVVNATTTSVTSISSTSYADVTNVTLSITPASSSSRILIMWASAVRGEISGYDDALPSVYFQLLRASTAVASENLIMSGSSSGTGGNGRELENAFGFHYVDSPATTSATTYKIQAKRTTPGGTTSVTIGTSFYNQSFTAFEIGA